MNPEFLSSEFAISFYGSVNPPAINTEQAKMAELATAYCALLIRLL